MKIFLLIFLGLISFNLSAQPEPVREFLRDSLHRYNERLVVREYQKPEIDFKMQTLLALSYYPELEGVKIQFKKKNLKTTMASIPKWNFLFRKKENRTYRIYIDTEVSGKKGLLLKDVPLNAQVGVIGHELGHITDYKNKTAVGLVLTGLGYLLPSFHKRLERKVDEITIAHGLGYQVKDFSDYVMNQSQADEKYKRFKRKYYYKPAQLARLMSGYSIY